MPGLLAVLLASAMGLSLEARAEGLRTVERARYPFAIDARESFDVAYPLAVFEAKARREADQERVLRDVFGVSVTSAQLAAEYDRIERDTRAPDQWRAMKRALGDDRSLTEEVVCRPLLAGRLLRSLSAGRRETLRR